MAADDFCYVTTTGRVSGRPHEIEIWYARPRDRSEVIYLLAGAGERSDWVRNLRVHPAATVRFGAEATVHDATGRVVDPGTDEDRLARELVFEKYQPRYSGDLTEWRGRALPVALDLT